MMLNKTPAILSKIMVSLGLSDNRMQEIKRINSWLKSHGVENYTIHEDLTVDVEFGVDLRHKQLKSIEVQFGVVKGSFICNNNLLTSLKGCPHIVGRNFDCSSNQLTHLQGCPKIVGLENNYPDTFKKFNCSYNEIASLNEGPKRIMADYIALSNPLENLKTDTVFLGSLMINDLPPGYEALENHTEHGYFKISQKDLNTYILSQDMEASLPQKPHKTRTGKI